MDRKNSLLTAVDTAQDEGIQLGKALSAGERNSSGTFEHWSPKDGMAHVAEWLARDIRDISSGKSLVEAADAETIDGINRSLYELHEGKTWDDSMEFFNRTYADCRALVEGMSEEDLEREVQRSDGTSRPVWRMIAGHALMHASSHFSMIYDRAGMPDKATAIEEKVSRIITGIDDSPEWAATATYNLACRYSLAGKTDEAISLLEGVFRISEDLKEWAGKDEDLDPLRDIAEFRALMS